MFVLCLLSVLRGKVRVYGPRFWCFLGYTHLTAQKGELQSTRSDYYRRQQAKKKEEQEAYAVERSASSKEPTSRRPQEPYLDLEW